MGVVVNFVEANQAPLQLGGSLVLAVFGYYISLLSTKNGQG